MSIFAGFASAAVPRYDVSAITAIRSALAYDRVLDTSSIDAEFESDFVVLKGQARSFEAIDRAVELARSLSSAPILNQINPDY